MAHTSMRTATGRAGLALSLLLALFSPALAQSWKPVVYCFAPGTPLETIQLYNQIWGAGDVQPFFVAEDRWPGTAGDPVALTWSLVPDGLNVDGQSSQLFSRMDALFAARGGRAAWIQAIQSAFDRWAALTGVSYTRIKMGANDWDDGAFFGASGGANRGDIRIGMISMDGSSGVLAYNGYPSSGGDMVLDRGEDWASPANNFRMLRNVIMHEHGHGLGLAHVCPIGGSRLMEPILDTSFDGPQHDDIRAVHSLYGDENENDDSAGTARSIGSLNAGASRQLGTVPSPAVTNGSLLSIDRDGDVDYFRFSVGGGSGLNVSVVPVGFNYDSSEQQFNGNCSSGNFINSLTRANLAVQVIAVSGNTLLGTASLAAAGQTETILELPLPGAGDYYLRVYETASVSGPQLYLVQMSLVVLDCNGNGTPDAQDLANGTSKDCNANGAPDECEDDLDSNGDDVPDTCQWSRGDFDLDGDVDMTDFGFFQKCLTGPAVNLSAGCELASLDGDTHVDDDDFVIFKACLSGENVLLDWECR